MCAWCFKKRVCKIKNISSCVKIDKKITQTNSNALISYLLVKSK